MGAAWSQVGEEVVAEQAKKWGEIQLVGEDGNIFAIIGKCRRQMKQMGATPQEVEAFQLQVSKAGSYDEALNIVSDWFEVQ